MFFYHSTKTLDSAKYIINKQWRTNMGMYGNGVYGQQYPDPTSSQNMLSSSTISRYKDMYGGTYRFKIKYNNPEDMFYLDLDAGKEAYGSNYDENVAIDILKKHNVPDSLISQIQNYFSNSNNLPAISHSVFNTDTVEGGLLGKYGFKGLVYQGNQDGKCILYWYPNNGDLEVEGYSTDFGKTWIDYDANNTVQVDALKAEIDQKIQELGGHVASRKQIKDQHGKTPALRTMGKDRDWIRIIECGDKSGYDFVNGNFTSGNINKFAGFVQKQINSSNEPKRSNRYDIAIKLLPEVSRLINK
jgi:hypothetical protein